MRQFKVVVLGDVGSGKSALEARFIQDGFVDSEKELEFDPTGEDDSYHRHFAVDGHTDSLEFLDTVAAGQFTSLMDIYIQSAQGFVLVFSLTREDSLEEVNRQLQHIYRIKGREKNIPIVVVANKLDLPAERRISRSTVAKLSERWDLPFFEASAKRNWHVRDVFEELVRRMRKWESVDYKLQKKRCASRNNSQELLHGVKPVQGCVIM